MSLVAAQRNVCLRMREIRQRLSLTQEDFDLEPDGVSVRQLSDIENLKQINVELKSLLSFCKIAGIHPKELFEFDIPWEYRSLPKRTSDRRSKKEQK